MHEVKKMNHVELKEQLKAFIRIRNIRKSKRNWKKNNVGMIKEQKKRAYKRKCEDKSLMNILL
jgi:hypothetical protein